MASFGEGFAGGLGQGMAMGKMLLDTYNEYDQKDKLKKAGELSPEEIAAGFTPDQQTTADFVSDPKNGYQVEKMENGGLRYRTADSENSWQELAPGAKKYKLGDKIQDTAFTQDQIDRARADAQSKVLLDAGDVKGAYGLRAMAREDRSGRQLEDVKDWKMGMLQNIAQGNYEPVLQELMPYYNKATPGSKFDDGHHATIDPRTNSVVFSNEKGQVVASHPINGKTLSEALNMAFEDKMAALDPKFGLDARKVKAAEKTADAAWEHYKPDGTAMKIAGMAAAARGGSGGGGMSAKAFDAKVNSLAANAVKVGEKGPNGEPLTLDQAKHLYGQLLIKNSEYGAPKVNSDGSIVQGGNVYVPDPNNPGKYLQAELPGGGPNPIVAAFANADPSKLKKPGRTAAAPAPESQLGLGQSLRMRAQGVDSEIARTKAALDKARASAKESDAPEEWGSTISTYERQLAALEAIKNKKGK